MIQQNIKFVIFYSVIQIFVFQQFRQLTMNVFVLLRIESERMYEMLQLAIEFLNRRFQNSIIIREQIFDLIRKRKLTIWRIYHFFMQLVNEFTPRNDSIRFGSGSGFAGSGSCRIEIDTVSIRFDSISDFFDFDSKSKWTSTSLCNDHVLFINSEFCDY
jgi:hypothetical protein